ncbi:3',5'-cyclic AMP phosphodiesterase CpdA [Tamaricihabitans halophyticus]|uniref:3',5'-cyclic AMP phosphodiesterase CpdA n=1 Tax=Tamaricihabitans halophyticus TaxID=1262583 RepID=A0A4R2QMV4_9PSEU|nr:metallophosphoesterase [Tamaricihabitans halophyticus]TCP50903.1 3',5'-cyclic AMP phosphodiesterase CpdA [Tamaricihabitans halophyticus]
MVSPSLLATSDLHVSHQGNREIVDRIRPRAPGDWLIVAGDVAEREDLIYDTLAELRSRFDQVIWVPGNHELWTTPGESTGLRGVARYEHLVQRCRSIDVLTPEDPYPIWRTDTEEFLIAPIFQLYDYSFRDPGTSLDTALDYAHEVGLVFSDEYLLHPDPYESRQQWCWARVAETERRLTAERAGRRTVLVSHWPLHPGPPRMMRHKHLAMWCGTERTADWHTRFAAAAVVYGHLHIPVTLRYDGVRFDEVSLGYPREWRHRTDQPEPVRRILPVDETRRIWNEEASAARG